MHLFVIKNFLFIQDNFNEFLHLLSSHNVLSFESLYSSEIDF